MQPVAERGFLPVEPGVGDAGRRAVRPRLPHPAATRLDNSEEQAHCDGAKRKRQKKEVTRDPRITDRVLKLLETENNYLHSPAQPLKV